MSFSINQSKINEELAKSTPAYIVSPCNLESTQSPFLDIPPIQIGSTTSGISPELEKFRSRVLSLRQQIIDRGEPSAGSPEELGQVMNAIRGRV